MSDFNPPRKTPDGAMATKGDAGTATTDPKFYRDAKAVTGNGWNGPWDMSGATAGKMLQDFWFQTKDAFLGDYVSVIIVSDGTDTETHGAENTQVGGFGECNVLMARDANGWSVQNDEAARFLTSYTIPAGLKIRFRYWAAGTDEPDREVLYDWLVHE